MVLANKAADLKVKPEENKVDEFPQGEYFLLGSSNGTIFMGDFR